MTQSLKRGGKRLQLRQSKRKLVRARLLRRKTMIGGMVHTMDSDSRSQLMTTPNPDLSTFPQFRTQIN